ncbi:hypothetical protein LX36DRAFT_371936 [Colletotrichum falcatum]|nr:hypothetical protein LX36DRAFT_371936 [Colletotrichum falcatum]
MRTRSSGSLKAGGGMTLVPAEKARVRSDRKASAAAHASVRPSVRPSTPGPKWPGDEPPSHIPLPSTTTTDVSPPGPWRMPEAGRRKSHKFFVFWVFSGAKSHSHLSRARARHSGGCAGGAFYRLWVRGTRGGRGAKRCPSRGIRRGGAILPFPGVHADRRSTMTAGRIPHHLTSRIRKRGKGGGWSFALSEAMRCRARVYW